MYVYIYVWMYVYIMQIHSRGISLGADDDNDGNPRQARASATIRHRDMSHVLILGRLSLLPASHARSAFRALFSVSSQHHMHIPTV